MPRRVMVPRSGFQVLATNVSTSNPTVIHEIRRGSDGVTYCTCPAWRFRRRCRHLDEYLIRSGEGISLASLISSTECEERHARDNAIPTEQPLGALRNWQVYSNDVRVGTMKGYSKADVLAKLVSYHGKQDRIAVKAR